MKADFTDGIVKVCKIKITVFVNGKTKSKQLATLSNITIPDLAKDSNLMLHMGKRPDIFYVSVSGS
jgi:hypothetical protein